MRFSTVLMGSLLLIAFTSFAPVSAADDHCEPRCKPPQHPCEPMCVELGEVFDMIPDVGQGCEPRCRPPQQPCEPMCVAATADVRVEAQRLLVLA